MSIMWGSDCNGCDPDLEHHLGGCPLAGELRDRLWLRPEAPEDIEGAMMNRDIEGTLTARASTAEEIMDYSRWGTPDAVLQQIKNRKIASGDYGERIPTHEDITAITGYMQAAVGICGNVDEVVKMFDRIGGVFEVYVEQFRKAENG